MRSAIVGCGSIAGVHAAVLTKSVYTQLTACADIRPERAQAMADACHIAAYGSLDELLDRERPDVLHICTPHHLHVPMALLALSRGVNVLMEKPPAISPESFEALLKEAGKSGLHTGVCFQNRYNPQVQYIRRALQGGQAGRVLGARAFVTWSRDDQYYTGSGWRGQWDTEGGGVLMNQSIHTMDLLVYLLGIPVSVEASMHNRHLPGVIQVVLRHHGVLFGCSGNAGNRLRKRHLPDAWPGCDGYAPGWHIQRTANGEPSCIGQGVLGRKPQALHRRFLRECQGGYAFLPVAKGCSVHHGACLWMLSIRNRWKAGFIVSEEVFWYESGRYELRPQG